MHPFAAEVCRWLLAAFCIFSCAQPAAAAGSANVTYNLTIASDYVYRGVSQTLGKAVLQPSVTLAHDNGLFAWVWASNVDYVRDDDPDDGARTEIDFVLGYSFELSSQTTLELSVLRFVAPGTIDGVNYDFNEYGAGIVFLGNHSLRADYSNSVWGTGGQSWHFAGSSRWPLAHGVSLSLEAGHFDLEDAFGDSYQYGSVSLSRAKEWHAWTLACYATRGATEDVFYRSITDPRFVLRLDLYF